MKVLMCPPAYYGIQYEINSWMHIDKQPNRVRAWEQWFALYRTLQTLGVKIELATPISNAPDMVFTANAGLLLSYDDDGCDMLLSNFKHIERSIERNYYEREEKFFIAGLNEHDFVFEGEGDALWVGDTLFVGYGQRTSEFTAKEGLPLLVSGTVAPVKLAMSAYYHLDTCFFPFVSPSQEWYAVWVPQAFSLESREFIEDYFGKDRLYALTPSSDMPCNSIQIGNTVLFNNDPVAGEMEFIRNKGLDIIQVDTTEFLKAGGGAKCLVLWLD